MWFTGRIFSFIHSNCSSKSKIVKENEESNNDKFNYIYEKPQLAPQKKTIKILIIIISILEYLSRSHYWIAYAITGAEKYEVSHALQRDITYTADIVMRYVLSIIILKIKIFKHHKFSLIIISFGFFFLFLADIIDFICINDQIKLGLSFLFALICLSKNFVSP